MKNLGLYLMVSFLLGLVSLPNLAQANVNININFVSGYYDVPEPTAVVYEQRLGNWEDLATLFFLSRLTGADPHVILVWRLGGVPWVGIIQRLHVPVSVFYVPVRDEDDYFAYHQGPPYGNAWGYWRHGPHGRVLVLNDEAVRRRVALISTSHYYGIPVDQEIRRIPTGSGSFEGIVREHEREKGSRPRFNQEAASHGKWKESREHGDRGNGRKGRGHEDNGEENPGHGEGRGQGHGGND